MPVLEPVVATLIANIEGFTARMGEAKAQMATFAEESKVAGAGAGENLAAGLAGGAGAAERDLGGSEKALKDVGTAAENSGKKMSILGSVLGNLPGPLGTVRDKTGEFTSKLDEASKSSGGLLGAIGSIPVPVLAAGAAMAATAAVSVDLASKYQTATNQIAANEGISVQAATNIGNAFFKTAGTTTFSAQQIATSFANVAAQAKTINGGVLSAAQSLDLMKAAADGAEASHQSLDAVSGKLLSTLQAFQLPISDASRAMSELYVAGNATGVGIAGVAQALARTRSRLGEMAPPLGDLSALLVDFTAHGITGRQAVSALGTTFQQFLKPATDMATAQKNLINSTNNLPPSLRALAAQYRDGSITSAQVTAETKNLNVSQTQLWGTFKSAADAARIAGDSYQKLGFNAVGANGQLLPLDQIIGKLHDQIKGMGPAMAQATLAADGFGSGAAKIVGTVMAGPAAFDKYKKAVEAQDAAHKAAEKATAGLRDSMEKVKVTLLDAATALGVKLMPAVTAVAHGISILVAKIVQEWPAISRVMKEGFDYVKPVLTALGHAIKSAFEFVIHNKAMLIAILGAIGVALLAMAAAAVVAWVSTLGPMAAVVAGIVAIGAVVGYIVSQWQPISGFFVGIWHDIYDPLKPIMGLIKAEFSILATAVKLAFGAIETVVKVVWAVVAGIVKADLDVIIGIVKVAVDLLTGNWKGAWNAIKATVTEVLNAIKGIVTSGFNAIVSFLVGSWNTIRSGVVSVWNDVLSFLEGIPSKILGVFAGAATWLLSIGEDIIKGLVNGIKNMADLPGRAVHDIAHSVIGIAKSILGIFSPSKVFADMGGNLMRGLANGIRENKELATAELHNINLTKGLERTFDDIAKAAVHMGNVLKFAATGLEDVSKAGLTAKTGIKPAADAIEQIGKALEKAGGLKLSSTFSKDLDALAQVSKSLSPGPITEGIQAIKIGLEALSKSNIEPSLTRDEAALKTFANSIRSVEPPIKSLTHTFDDTLSALRRVEPVLAEMAKDLTTANHSTAGLSTALRSASQSLTTMRVAIEASAKALSGDFIKALDNDRKAAQALEPTFKAVTTSVTTGSLKVKDSVKDWTVFGTTLEGVTKTSTTLTANITDIAKKIDISSVSAKALDRTFSDLNVTVQQTNNRFTQMMSTLVQRGSAGFTMLKNIITEFGDRALETFRSLDGSITSAFADLVPRLISIGQSIVDGLTAGVSSKSSELNSALANVMNSAISAAQSAAKVHSPSLVFHEIGENLMLGLANGITNTAHLVHSALTNVGLGLGGAISIGVGGGTHNVTHGGYGGNPIMNGTPIVLSVTTPIQIDGRTIATTITQYQLQNARSTNTVLGQYSGGSQTGAATSLNVNAISR